MLGKDGFKHHCKVFRNQNLSINKVDYWNLPCGTSISTSKHFQLRRFGGSLAIALLNAVRTTRLVSPSVWRSSPSAVRRRFFSIMLLKLSHDSRYTLRSSSESSSAGAKLYQESIDCQNLLRQIINRKWIWKWYVNAFPERVYFPK